MPVVSDCASAENTAAPINRTIVIIDLYIISGIYGLSPKSLSFNELNQMPAHFWEQAYKPKACKSEAYGLLKKHQIRQILYFS